MILNRLRDRMRNQDWFGVGLEVLIVVLGVFLGIQASNWNEARVERDMGRAYHQRLGEDFNANARDLDTRAFYYRQVRRHAVAALEALHRPLAADAAQQFLIDAYETTQVAPRSMKRNTWDEILSTGAMNRMGTPDEREMVSNYYLSVATIEFTFQTVTPYRGYMRARMPYDVQARVRERCPERFLVDDKFNVASRLAEHCSLGLAPARAIEAASFLREDPQLEALLNAAITDLDQKILLASTFRANTRKFRRLWAGQS
jgi:hypothetical protein